MHSTWRCVVISCLDPGIRKSAPTSVSSHFLLRWNPTGKPFWGNICIYVYIFIHTRKATLISHVTAKCLSARHSSLLFCARVGRLITLQPLLEPSFWMLYISKQRLLVTCERLPFLKTEMLSYPCRRSIRGKLHR